MKWCDTIRKSFFNWKLLGIFWLKFKTYFIETALLLVIWPHKSIFLDSRVVSLFRGEWIARRSLFEVQIVCNNPSWIVFELYDCFQFLHNSKQRSVESDRLVGGLKVGRLEAVSVLMRKFKIHASNYPYLTRIMDICCGVHVAY